MGYINKLAEAINRLKFFQFPLWDTLLRRMVDIKGVGFQFPLWDTPVYCK